MRPPSKALVRAGSSRAHNLLGLLALANEICRLVADIQRFDKLPVQPSVRSPSSQSSAKASAKASAPALRELLSSKAASPALTTRNAPSSSTTRPGHRHVVRSIAPAVPLRSAPLRLPHFRFASTAVTPLQADVPHVAHTAEISLHPPSGSPAPIQSRQSANKSLPDRKSVV